MDYVIKKFRELFETIYTCQNSLSRRHNSRSLHKVGLHKINHLIAQLFHFNIFLSS